MERKWVRGVFAFVSFDFCKGRGGGGGYFLRGMTLTRRGCCCGFVVDGCQEGLFFFGEMYVTFLRIGGAGDTMFVVRKMRSWFERLGSGLIMGGYGNL